MIFRTAKRLATGRAVKFIPLYRVIAVAQVGLLAKRHFDRLAPGEGRRLTELVRRSRSLTAEEKVELRALTAKLEPRLFVGAAVDQFSPVPLPRKLTGAPKKQKRRAVPPPPASFRK